MEFKEEDFKTLLAESKPEFSIEGFEDQVMEQIELQVTKQNKILDYKMFSLIFFALGALFGIAGNYLVTKYIDHSAIDEEIKSQFNLFSLLGYTIFILILSYKLWQIVQLRKLKW